MTYIIHASKDRPPVHPSTNKQISQVHFSFWHIQLISNLLRQLCHLVLVITSVGKSRLTRYSIQFIHLRNYSNTSFWHVDSMVAFTIYLFIYLQVNNYLLIFFVKDGLAKKKKPTIWIFPSTVVCAMAAAQQWRRVMCVMWCYNHNMLMTWRPFDARKHEATTTTLAGRSMSRLSWM